MGQYHYLFNLTKKEWISPHLLGDGAKLIEQIESSSIGGIQSALMILLSCSNGRGGGDILEDKNVVGRWSGDKIAIIGDYAEAGDIKRYRADKIISDEGCEEFTNISHLVREYFEKNMNVKYTRKGSEEFGIWTRD